MGCVPVRLQRCCRQRAWDQIFTRDELRILLQFATLIRQRLATASPSHLQGICELTLIQFFRPTASG